MRCQLTFSRTPDSQLLVLVDFTEGIAPQFHTGITVTRFGDENVFLYYVVLSELEDEVTTDIIANTLLVMSDRAVGTPWTTVDCTERQLRALGLNVQSEERSSAFKAETFPSNQDFKSVLMQSPAPITLMSGPKHEFTFINPAYVRLMGRRSEQSVLGKPVRQALPELHGQPFFGLLDRVYRTGEPFVGREVPAKLKNEITGLLEDFYFDFVYHPVRDGAGEISGILAQANDVTERVIARQVSEAREAQLYKQWAELEAIYRKSPVGMALVDISHYRILRINEMNASWIGLPMKELIGRPIFTLFPALHQLKSIYERVAGGEEVRDVQFDMIWKDSDSAASEDRHMLLNFSPVFDATGQIDAIASIGQDITETVNPHEHVVVDMSACRAAFAAAR